MRASLGDIRDESGVVITAQGGAETNMIKSVNYIQYILQKISDYMQLTKPRIVLLFGLTGLATMVLQGGLVKNPFAFWMVFLGTILTAGSANAFNQYLDRDIDSVMERTRKKRPIPLGKISPQNAFGFALVTGAIATALLLLYGGVLSAVLGVATILYYVCLYTMWLKRLTPQNIVIGGAAGASAPLIAWAAGTNTISIDAWLLFLLIFLWTPPHFWALSLCIKDEYAQANVPMLPVVKGADHTRLQILAYSVLLLPLTIAIGFVSNLSFVYFVPVVLLGAEFLRKAWRLYVQKDEKSAWKLFAFSIMYLLAVFSFILVDAIFLRPVQAAEPTPPQLENVGITEHLGAQIDLSLKFKNEEGKIVSLLDIVNGKQPVLLLPIYFGCPNLCNFTVNGAIDGFKKFNDKFKWAPAKNFQVIAFSIDPREDEALAGDKKENVMKALGILGAESGWHFWSNPETSTNPESTKNNSGRILAEQIGFGYRFDKSKNQFAHSAGMIVLTPDGKISRYLYGIDFRPNDLKLALVEAGGRKVGSIMDRLILYCYQYDPNTRSYSFYIFNLMKAASLLTVVLMLLGIFWLRRKSDKDLIVSR